MLAGPLHADGSPGRATEAAKEAAGKLLERIKCPAFSPLDLRNGFPSTIKVKGTIHKFRDGCMSQDARGLVKLEVLGGN